MVTNIEISLLLTTDIVTNCSLCKVCPLHPEQGEEVLEPAHGGEGEVGVGACPSLAGRGADLFLKQIFLSKHDA